MAMEYIKKVGIHVIYVEHYQILKIFPNFKADADSAGYGTKNVS